MEKRRAHYALTRVKSAFSDPARLNRTMSAVFGAEDLDMDERAVADAIAALTSADFDKSMTAHGGSDIWQDVYKPVAAGHELYVKITRDARGELLLISFKANEP